MIIQLMDHIPARVLYDQVFARFCQRGKQDEAAAIYSHLYGKPTPRQEDDETMFGGAA